MTEKELLQEINELKVKLKEKDDIIENLKDELDYLLKNGKIYKKRGRPTKKHDDDLQRLQDLLNQNLKHDEIMKMLNMTRATYFRRLKELNKKESE